MRNRFSCAAVARVVSAVCLFATSSATHATPITFVHTGTASGTLNGEPFGPSYFTVTSVADTLNRQSSVVGFSIDHNSSSIAISGLGVLNVLTPTRTFNNQFNSTVGYSRAGVTGADLLFGPTDGAFATWDMLSGIGPIAGDSGLVQWGFLPQINTSGGILIFDDGSFPATFTAISPPVIPSDFDRDGDVDRTDWEHFQTCALGPAVPQTDPGCSNARLDADDDVDMDDHGIFQRCYGNAVSNCGD
jgi:hypothetical protein